MKYVKVTLRYPKPDRQAVLRRPCPYPECKAKVGAPCVRSAWFGRDGGRKTKMSTFHQDRVAATLGLRVVQTSSVYEAP